MSYYKPWSANIAIGVLSILNTFQWIAVGVFVTSLMVLFTAYEAARTGVVTELPTSKMGFEMESPDGNMTEDEFIAIKRIVLIAWAVWMIIAWFVTGSQKAIYTVMAENLTFQVRVELIKSLFHKQICWYDRESRAPGVITSITSSNVVQLNGMTSELAGTLVEMILMMVVSLTGGLLICWQQAILVFALSPILIGGTIAAMNMQWKK